MVDRHAQQKKKSHLRMGLIWLAIWACVAYLMISGFAELNGVQGVVEKIKEGEYLMPALLAGSITLLALAIRSLALYFSPGSDAK
jgi:hypothetical protein